MVSNKLMCKELFYEVETPKNLCYERFKLSLFHFNKTACTSVCWSGTINI